jgi:hypothetical protein
VRVDVTSMTDEQLEWLAAARKPGPEN